MAFPTPTLPQQPAQRMGISEGLGEVITFGKHFTPSGAGLQRFCGGSFNEQSSPAQRSIVSDSANDANPAGSGARVVLIRYLDGSFNQQETIVPLSGLTAVDTSALDIQRVIDMFIVFAGNNPYRADGTITLKAGTGGAGADMLQILPGESFAQCMTMYSHASKNLVLTHLFFASPSPSDDIFQLRIEFDPAGSPGDMIQLFEVPEAKNLPSDFDILVTLQGKIELFVNVSPLSVGRVFSALFRGYLLEVPAA